MNAMNTVAAASLLALSTLFFSCGDDDNNNPAIPVDNTDTFGATLNGAQQVPVVSTTATGAYSASFDRTSRVLNYTVTYQGLEPTAGHIHSVSAATAEGNTGGISVPFAATLTTPLIGQATLTLAQQDEMYANKTYANLHTAAYPDGEIRGNIKKTD